MFACQVHSCSTMLLQGTRLSVHEIVEIGVPKWSSGTDEWKHTLLATTESVIQSL